MPKYLVSFHLHAAAVAGPVGRTVEAENEEEAEQKAHAEIVASIDAGEEDLGFCTPSKDPEYEDMREELENSGDIGIYELELDGIEEVEG